MSVTVWAVCCDSYEGQPEFELYDTEAKAIMAAWNRIAELLKKDEAYGEVFKREIYSLPSIQDRLELWDRTQDRLSYPYYVWVSEKEVN